MLDALAGEVAVKAAEELGLIYTVRDRLAGELLTGPAILREDVEKDADDEDIAQEEGRRGRRRHVQAAHWYERLYREERDPRWLRESYYHTTINADPERLRNFGVLYRDELFAAGEYWFQDDKDFKSARDFKSALVAFQAAYSLGLRTYLCRMRIASCRMRVGDRKAGEDLYHKLIAEYSNNSGPKTSYVGIRETHQRQPMVADPDLARTVQGFIEEDVHHVAVLVKKRGPDLEHARTAFPERHVAVELLFQ
jgi:hypothetical protein